MKTVQNLEWKEVDFRQNTPNQWYFQPVMKYNAQKISLKMFHEIPNLIGKIWLQQD